jgi:hypothetical protein
VKVWYDRSNPNATPDLPSRRRRRAAEPAQPRRRSTVPDRIDHTDQSTKCVCG